MPEDGDSDEMDRRRGWKDGATNGAGEDSRRAVTLPLAGDEASQYQLYERTRTDVPITPGRLRNMTTRWRNGND